MRPDEPWIAAAALLAAFLSACAVPGEYRLPRPGAAVVTAPAAPPARPTEAAVSSRPESPGTRSAPGPGPASVTRPRAAETPPAEEEGLLEDDEADALAGRNGGAQAALQRALGLCRLAQAHAKRGHSDQAIEALDAAYALVLETDPGSDPVLLQEKEDLRLTISRRILEVYAPRRFAGNGGRNEIPIDLNAHVQAEIDSFTVGRERDFFTEALRRSGRYRGRMEAALREAGLPAELSWLPLIESGFKPTALSPARALGLWQFIPSTGYRYNLNRDTYIDERLDPEKSTRGAIEYLKDLHGMFGDWLTVLAAYNCGEHRVMRTIQSQNINYLDHFWDLYEKLPRETARYVPRFLATLHIVQNLERYGLADLEIDPPLDYETVAIPRQASLRGVALATGIEECVLRELNTELRQGVLPESGYELRVPPGAAARVAEQLEEIPLYRPPARAPLSRHKVAKGESLEGIARRYKVSVKELLAANPPLSTKTPPPGTVLTIPAGKSPSPSALPPPAARGIEHTVQRGESLASIARRYRVAPEEIQRANRLSSSALRAGQVLKIPAGRAAPAATGRGHKIYAVQAGDTLSSIARKHSMSLERLLALNRLTAEASLQPGQRLIVEN
ncbi:MAG: LysM peptidoglycan-binding domain-containing protein [Desulfobacterales bacterium]